MRICYDSAKTDECWSLRETIHIVQNYFPSFFFLCLPFLFPFLPSKQFRKRETHVLSLVFFYWGGKSPVITLSEVLLNPFWNCKMKFRHVGPYIALWFFSYTKNDFLVVKHTNRKIIIMAKRSCLWNRRGFKKHTEVNWYWNFIFWPPPPLHFD